MSDIQNAFDIAFETAARHRGSGDVANYIPALARVDPNRLAFVVTGLDGNQLTAGDADVRFSIQSISKVFTLAMALERVGDALWTCVGREPSGSAFNSIVQLEHENGVPRNPFINAGAIAVTDRLVSPHGAINTVTDILDMMQSLSGDENVHVDFDVAMSEERTGDRNKSLAHFMAAYGRLRHPVETTLRVYFHQCALAMTPASLGKAGLFLANGGVNPLTGDQVVSAIRAQRINALMMACGHYDNSGEFAFRVGLPGKSGVGGGILVIAPGKGTIVAWSPGLNQFGTSLAGALAIETFAKETGWSVFR